MSSSARISFLALTAVLTVAAGHAQSILGGSALLDVAKVTQLGNWLGEGPLQVTNIYTKVAGDTSGTFHTAANSKGRTFSIIEVNVGGTVSIIGGYNPHDWVSSPVGFQTDTLDANRTAFIFNLTSGVRQAQILGTSFGQHTTYNDVTAGPAFGDSDIFVFSSLNSGFAGEFAYGVSPTNILGTTTTQGFTVERMEVFTLAADPVPEPATLLVLGAGALIVTRRRRAR